MKKGKVWKGMQPYLWLLPSILLMAIFILVPIYEVFHIAFSDVSKA